MSREVTIYTVFKIINHVKKKHTLEDIPLVRWKLQGVSNFSTWAKRLERMQVVLKRARVCACVRVCVSRARARARVCVYTSLWRSVSSRDHLHEHLFNIYSFDGCFCSWCWSLDGDTIPTQYALQTPTIFLPYWTLLLSNQFPYSEE